MHTHAHSYSRAHVEVGGRLWVTNICSSLLLLCGSWRQNSGHETGPEATHLTDRPWNSRYHLPGSGMTGVHCHARGSKSDWIARAKKQSTTWLPPAPETARHEHWTHLWHFEKMEPNEFWLRILSDSFESIKNTVNVSENLPQYIVLPRGKFVKSV